MRQNHEAAPPTPQEVLEARTRAKLTQPQAADVVYVTRRTWQNYEAGSCPMHPGLWELFNIKTRM